MNMRSIYTIGHGSRKMDDFLFLLKEFGIEYLIDVRSLPYSKFYPQYNQAELSFSLDKNLIKYVFMGDSMGGRPKDKTCYDIEGKVDYEKLKNKDFFLQGIERLKTAYKKSVKIALMCSESNPCECHRSKLIGRVLDIDNIVLRHIDEYGKLKDQATVINELNKGLPEFDLFGNPINVTSKKSYM